MALSTVTHQVAARVLSPRGVRPLRALATGLYRGMGRFFLRTVEGGGSMQAARELSRLAVTFDGPHPHLAADLRAAAKHCESLARVSR